MSEITPTSRFKKRHEEVEKNPRWHSIFYGEVPFPDDHRPPWEYTINCLLNDEPIPDYFYEHPVTLIVQQKSQTKSHLGSLSQTEIRGLDLHFGSHSDDHLSLYIWTNQGIVYLVGVGAHSDLF